MARPDPQTYALRMPPEITPQRLAVAKSLKAARVLRNLSQEDVSFELRSRGAEHDSLGTVKRWETLGSIKLDDAVLLAQIYEMTLDELLNASSTHPDDRPSATQDLAAELGARDKELGSRGQRRRRKRPPSSG